VAAGPALSDRALCRRRLPKLQRVQFNSRTASSVHKLPVRHESPNLLYKICHLQLRQFPPSISQYRKGISSYEAIAFPHLGQLDAGRTIDLSAGMRRMHTFRKLPSTRPNKNTPRGITLRLCHTRRAPTTPAPSTVTQTGNRRAFSRCILRPTSGSDEWHETRSL
jgi:hypothetical protein